MSFAEPTVRPGADTLAPKEGNTVTSGNKPMRTLRCTFIYGCGRSTIDVQAETPEQAVAQAGEFFPTRDARAIEVFDDAGRLMATLPGNSDPGGPAARGNS